MLDEDGVRSLLARQVLTMLYQRSIGVLYPQVLVNASSQASRQHLYASAYTQHGHLLVGGHAYQLHLRHIALGIDRVQLGDGFFAYQKRVQVATTTQHYGIQTIQKSQQCLLVHVGRDNNRTATRRKDTLIVSLG